MSNRIRKTGTGRNDSGATALLVALSMVVLMGFAAVAVDGGILFSDRRQQQSAADGGALAAVQFAKTTLATTNCGALTGIDLAACRGAEEAIDVVDGTLPGRYALVGDWDTCVDAGKPAEYTQSSTLSDCISFTDNLQKARVLLPGTDVDTSFARVIGFNSVRVSAFAEANLDLNQSGGVLPFAVGPSGASGTQACFFAQSSGNLDIDPCDTADEGNFGKLDVRLYKNSTMSTPEICSGQTAQRMSTNIVLGSDHPLELVGKSPGIINDDTNCALITNEVDEVITWTGNAAGALADGLFNGIATPATEGRIACKGGLSTSTADENPAQGFVSNQCADINSLFPEDIDHTPLWDFITPGASAESGGACVPSITDRAGMDACLVAWKAWGMHAVSLFEPELTDSPRFAAVPVLNADPGNGSGNYLITDFRPIYIETVYFKCNAFICDVVHSPGEDTNAAPPAACPNPMTGAITSCGWPSVGNKGIEAVSSFMLTLDMLDDETAKNFPNQEGTIVFNLSS